MKQLQDWFRIKEEMDGINLTQDRKERGTKLDHVGKLLRDYKSIYDEKFDYLNKPREENK